MSQFKHDTYRGARVLITGGLGFLGSSLAHALVQSGAKVTLLDNLNPIYGGNRFNIEEIKDSVITIIDDVRNQDRLRQLIPVADYIFHFAAQVSHIDSGTIPLEDNDTNARAYLALLDLCRQLNPKVKILFPSSRLALGKLLSSPVSEDHPARPLNIYGVHKLSAEHYSRIYAQSYGLRTVVLRLTNPYGPRQQIKHSKYSIPGWFMRLAMEEKEITMFGAGEQKRDYIYVDDVTDAFLMAGASSNTDGKLYNCGTGDSITFREMIDEILSVVGSGSVRSVPWPENYEREETGDFEVDISLLRREAGWNPHTGLHDGLERMYQYYRRVKDHYVA